MICHHRRASLPRSIPVTQYEDVAALGMNLEVGYRSTPDDFEIVSIVILHNLEDRDNQTEANWILESKRAVREIKAEMMAGAELGRMIG